MRFGICTKASNLEYIKNLGYDYAELELRAVSKMSDEELEAACADTARLGIFAETFNLFCSSSLYLTHDLDLASIEAYAKAAFSRAARLGGEIIVIGSGGARRVPEGYSSESARENFLRVINLVSDIAAAHRLKIAIEPLNRNECNFVNTLAEAAQICEAIGRENVGCLADLYHIYKNGEDMADICRYGEHIIHTHIAKRDDSRSVPSRLDFADFNSALDGIGYSGRMSLECFCKDSFEVIASDFYSLVAK